MTLQTIENLLLTSSTFIKQKEFWLSQLTSDIVETELIFETDTERNTADAAASDMVGDTVDVTVGGSGGESGAERTGVTMLLPGNLSEGLMKLGRQSDITIFIILLAAVKALIYRYTGSEDITVISPLYKDYISEETMNDLVFVRDFLRGSMTFKELLIQCKQSVLDAYEHQDYPRKRIIHFLFDDAPGVGLKKLSNVVCRFGDLHAPLPAEMEAGCLEFAFSHREEGVELRLLHVAGRYDTYYVRQVVNHLVSLLSTALTDLDTAIDGFLLVGTEERERLLVEFNRSGADYPRDKAIHRIFEEQVERTPDSIALFHELPGAGVCGGVSYGELNRRADCLAATLRERGMERGAIVAIMTENQDRMVTGILGILKAGGAYLPINQDHPPKRKEMLMTDSGSKLLLTETLFIDGDTGGAPGFHREMVDSINLDDEALYLEGDGKDGAEGEPGDIMYVMYTSGSTGLPKGVVVEHRNAANVLSWFGKTYNLEPGTRLLQLTDYFFDPSIEDIFGTLIHGGTLFTGSRDLVVDGALFRRFVIRNRIHILNFVPKLLAALLGDGPKLESLRVVISGGEKLENHEKDRLLAGGYALYNNYGPTEITVDALSARCGEGKVTLGTPIANTHCYILDNQTRLVPVGAMGELCIAGAGVARGYLNKPELTDRCFVDNPFLQGEKMYKTGDLARWTPDGEVEFLGRLDQQVKIRGYRIELGEIECRLAGHPAVSEVVVLPGERENGDKYLCAYFVPVSEDAKDDLSTLDPAITTSLRNYTAEKIPVYMIPGHFIPIEKIPLTANGKVDLRALPVPKFESSEQYVAPRNDIEKLMVDMWGKVLQVNGENIGIDTNFFELGGHSLRAITLVSKIEKEFNRKFSLENLFQAPTIRKLAKRMEGEATTAYSGIEPVGERAYHPLSFAQKRILVAHQMDVSGISYNIGLAVRLQGDLDYERVEKTLTQLIERHESFRTSFDFIDNEPVQKISRVVDFSLKYYPCTGGEAEIEAIRKRFHRPFDLAKAPLLRAGLVKLGELDNVLMVDMHHLVADGLSVDIFTREFAGLYQGNLLEPLRVQYKDYSHWHNGMDESGELAAQEVYWLNRFSGEIPELKLPTDFPRPAVRNIHEGDLIRFSLEPSWVTRLYDAVKETNSTVFTFLFTVFNVLLFKYSGRGDVVVGTPVTGRSHGDLKNVIGVFINMLPMRNRVEGNKTFKQLLNEIKENALAALENQDYPFDRLVSKLGLQGETNRNPLFDTEFSMDSLEVRDMEFSGLTLTGYDSGIKFAKYDLHFLAVESEGGISMVARYSTQLYRETTIRKLEKYYIEILRQAVEDLDLEVDEISLSHEIMSTTSAIQEDADSDFVF